MEVLIKSEVFSLGDSTFLIDIVRGDDGQEFIRLKRIIERGPRAGSKTIEFNEHVLYRILVLLKARPDEVISSTISRPSTNPRLKRLSEVDRADIAKTYLKNVSPANIAVRYGCSASDIEEVLRDAGLPIEPTEPPKNRRWRRRY